MPQPLRPTPLGIVLLLAIGLGTAAPLAAQSPAGYQYQGLGRSSGGAPPSIPAEVMNQLPPGCTSAWQPTAQLQLPSSPIGPAPATTGSPHPQAAVAAAPQGDRGWLPPPQTPRYLQAHLGQLAPFPQADARPATDQAQLSAPLTASLPQVSPGGARLPAYMRSQPPIHSAAFPQSPSSTTPNRLPGITPSGEAAEPIPLGVPMLNPYAQSTPGPTPRPTADEALLPSDSLLPDDLLGDEAPLSGGDDLLGGNDLLGGDDLLGADQPLVGDDPLSSMAPQPSALPTPHAGASAGVGLSAPQTRVPGEPDPHAELLAEHAYPSAQTCAKCHPKHFEEWRTSAHAYAVLSPMYQRFEQTMIELTEGTVGTFCARCHGPVAIQMEYPRAASALDAPAIVREGITCIACHRVNEAYGRTNGQRRIEPGDIYEPVYGGGDGQGLARAISQREQLKLKLTPEDKSSGQPIHREARYFEPITRSDFCASCHQVAVHPGIWLEVVHAQYRSGPAAAKGISCQDCHMGAVPGKPEGYEQCQIAELGGKPWGDVRKHANHTFWGPGYSIAHPGVFPIHEKAARWTPREWLAFDYYSDWGKDDFERNVPAGMSFPAPWDNTDDRRDARKIIEANQASLDRKRGSSIDVMESALAIEGPFFKNPPTAASDLQFTYRVRNISEGHNLPTGSLGAQPQVWLNVALIGPDGRSVWESGYLDSNGDLADLQSQDVALGKLPRDAQLFNLQTKFLLNSFRGTDREVALPLNFNLDQLVFLRPGAVPVTVLNHPPSIRMEAHSIPPLGYRDANYRIPAIYLQQPGTYRLSVRMRSRPEPSYLMRQVGATPDMIRRMNEGILNMHPRSQPFIVR